MLINKQDRSYRPLVYIFSPLTGDIPDNNEKTRRFCRFALEKGQIPLAPQLMFSQFMDDGIPEERDLVLFMDIVLLGKCSELWVFGDYVSEGMVAEIEVAKRRKQKIRYFSTSLQEVEVL